ncbi:hypothetical protein CRG98_030309 [Punica granatum]|uniref:RNase H type-1 domain-containing protein n=1 Tax=Punica granatum TaxID=22663 RepID=A0A2I0IZF3_PUNGR|nr:hypothetical protein CRG98_030309 [Punica granatum]
MGKKELTASWCNLNTDGAAEGNPGKAGARGLIRDEHGKWLGGFAQNIGITTSVLAELWAVKTGLELAWDLEVRKLILEVDSEVVYHLLQSNRDQPVGYGPLLRDICVLSHRDWSIVPEHVYREGTCVRIGR